MSMHDAAVQVTIGYIVMGSMALLFWALLVGPGFDYARDTWRHYKKQRSHGYSRRDALRLAIDYLNWRI
jgi:hypothetical protein